MRVSDGRRPVLACGVLLVLSILGAAAQSSDDCGPRFVRDPAATARAIAIKKASLRRQGLPERFLGLLDREQCVGCVEMAADSFSIMIEYGAGQGPTDDSGRHWTSVTYKWDPVSEREARQDLRDHKIKSFRIMNTATACECCGTQPYRERADWDPVTETNTSQSIVYDDPNQLGPDPEDLSQPPANLMVPVPPMHDWSRPVLKQVHTQCPQRCSDLEGQINAKYSTLKYLQDELYSLHRGIDITRQAMAARQNQIATLQFLNGHRPQPARSQQIDELLKVNDQQQESVDSDIRRFQDTARDAAATQKEIDALLARLADCEKHCVPTETAAAKTETPPPAANRTATGVPAPTPAPTESTPAAAAAVTPPPLPPSDLRPGLASGARASSSSASGDKAALKAKYSQYADELGMVAPSSLNPLAYTYAYSYFADGTGNTPADRNAFLDSFGPPFTTYGPPGSAVGLSTGGSMFPSRLPGFQTMMLDGFFPAFQPLVTPPPGERHDEAASFGAAVRWLAAWFERPWRADAPPAFAAATLRASAARPSDFARQAPAGAAGAAPTIELVLTATGASTGRAFTLEAVNPTNAPFTIGVRDGVVVEPVAGPPPPPRPGARVVREALNGYCLEFANQAPAPGTVFRVADEAAQKNFRPLRDLLRAARRLQRDGQLAPDALSSPADYLDATKQWALWTKIGGWDAKTFEARFLERTEKNLKDMKVAVTDDLKKQVKALIPGRWRHVQAVLAEAERLGRQPPRGDDPDD